MDVVFPVLGLSFLGSVAGLLGGVVLLFNKRWGTFLWSHVVAFAAGVLLAVSLLDLLPEALEERGIEQALLIVLGVMVAASLLEQLIVHFHHHEDHTHSELKSAIPLVLFGDAIHNFLDGVTIAAAFLTEPRLGLFVAIATFLHELPQEIGDFGILKAAGWKTSQIIGFNLLTAATTFVGALGTLVFASSVAGASSLLLTVAAGLFLYIAATDLLPKVGARAKDVAWHQTALFLAGVATMMVITNVLPK